MYMPMGFQSQRSMTSIWSAYWHSSHGLQHPRYLQHIDRPALTVYHSKYICEACTLQCSWFSPFTQTCTGLHVAIDISSMRECPPDSYSVRPLDVELEVAGQLTACAAVCT